jgi:hypothetical protein
MAVDLAIIGIGAKIILGVVIRGRQRQSESAGAKQS